jgi:hypothetical protein
MGLIEFILLLVFLLAWLAGFAFRSGQGSWWYGW